MDFSKITGKNLESREAKGKSKDIAVSDDEMAAFSQMLDEKADLGKDISREAIFSQKDEKKADAEKQKQPNAFKPEQKMSASKEMLYNANRDKSIMSLGQKSALGVGADGLSKAAMLNGGMTNLAHLAMQMSKNGENSAQLLTKNFEKDVKKTPGEKMSAISTNANVMADALSENKPEPEIKMAAKAEQADAERNLKREDVIKQIINHVELKNLGNKSELTIKMNPEFLGSMKMRLMFEGDKVSAEFNTTSTEVREALAESTEELSQALAENGIKVGKINVHLVDNVA